MKKLCLTLLLGVISVGAYAQGGSWYVGGVGGFLSSSDNFGNETSITGWTFSPEVGWFIQDRISVGVSLGMSGSGVSDVNGDISDAFEIMPTIYGRYWFPVVDNFNLFVGADIGFGSGSTDFYFDDPIPDVTEEYSTFNINANVGAAYMLAPNWTLLLKGGLIGYDSMTVDDETTSTFSLVANTDVTNSPFFFVGVYWTFLGGQ